MKTQSLVQIVLLAGVGYLLYKFADKFKQGANYVEDTAAKTYLTVEDWFTGYSPAQVAGSVVFPSGALVALKNLSVTPYNGPNGFEARVTYQGRTYRLAPHDANGNYPATPV